jgi:hypothetical protein
VKFFRFIPVALAATLLAGCATTYRVQVSALAHPTLAATARTYTFATPEGKGTNPGDLQYQEVLRHVQRALATRGFSESTGAEANGLNIFVDFGVGDPVTRTYTFSTPIYAELGGGYTTRTRRTTDAAGKTSTTTETVRVPGRYERVGTDVTTNSVTTYRKHLRLSARLREAGVPPAQGREIWTVTAVCDDQLADLRAALPLLTEAIAPYAGTDTGRAIVVEFEEQDGRLVPVRR